MTSKPKDDLNQYMEEARSWETDKTQELMRSRTVAWRVAAGAGLVAVMAVFAVLGLTPLKTVEPYVIRVDNTTGIVDVVQPLTDGKTNYEETVNKYFVQQYVRFREGYSRQLAEEYYNNVGLMSSSQEQARYGEYFRPSNHLSPLVIYGDSAKVRIRVKSVSFISPTVALVRYLKEVERGRDKPLISHWAATISFRYTRAPMAEVDRAVNPLGFQVLEYRNDPDGTLPEHEASGALPSGVDAGPVTSAAPPAALLPEQPAGVVPAAPVAINAAPRASQAAPTVPAIRSN